jgi:hypothetical protein
LGKPEAHGRSARKPALRNAYFLKVKNQKTIIRIAMPKKQAKKTNATLKNGPKKFFHMLAAYSGETLARPHPGGTGAPRSGAPQSRQKLSSRSTGRPHLGQCVVIRGTSFNASHLS